MLLEVVRLEELDALIRNLLVQLALLVEHLISLVHQVDHGARAILDTRLCIGRLL